MKLLTAKFLLSVIAGLFFAVVVPAQEADEDKDLPNFYKVNASLYRGGQPSEEGIKRLARTGVKTIINLRGEDEHSQKEKLWAERAGIKFIAVNLSNWFKPETADVDRILKMIDAPGNQPVFVHCKRGADRTGTIIAVYHITHDNWTAKRAIDDAKEKHLGWWQFWMKDFIEDYAKEKK